MTGTSVCTTKTTGATRIAGRRCSALISQVSPKSAAVAAPAAQLIAVPQWPCVAASATNWLASPLQAKPSPAPIIVTFAVDRPVSWSANGVKAAAPSRPNTM